MMQDNSPNVRARPQGRFGFMELIRGLVPPLVIIGCVYAGYALIWGDLVVNVLKGTK